MNNRTVSHPQQPDLGGEGGGGEKKRAEQARAVLGNFNLCYYTYTLF